MTSVLYRSHFISAPLIPFIIVGTHIKARSHDVEFPYSNMIKCGVCGGFLTAELKKGKYILSLQRLSQKRVQEKLLYKPRQDRQSYFRDIKTLKIQ